MKHLLAATVLLGAASLPGIALSQTQPAQPPRTPPAAAPATPAPSATPRPATTPTAGTVAASALERGANSFTEGQARSRFEDAGFSGVQNLIKDESGFWRARGVRNGTSVDLAMDFRGRIAAGPDVASLPPPAPASASTRPTTPAPAAPPRSDTAPPASR